MMYKSRPSAAQRLRATAMVPAIALALAVTQIPTVATAMETLSRTSLPGSVDKDTKMSVQGQGHGDQTSTRASSVMPYSDKADNVITVADPKEKEEISLTPAQFSGGEVAIYKLLTENLRYPEAAYKNHVEGRVVIRFEISETGKVSNPAVMRGVSPELDAEALRVVSELPDFIPATQDGKAVASTYALPVEFRLK